MGTEATTLDASKTKPTQPTGQSGSATESHADSSIEKEEEDVGGGGRVQSELEKAIPV